MNTILIKIFATALAFSQVTTRPDAVKTAFDPVNDQAEVAQILSAGCARMRKTFDIEAANLDDLIAVALDDKEAIGQEVKALRGLSIADLHAAYRQFCKNETLAPSPVDLAAVIAFYNEAARDLPDPAAIKGTRPPGMSVITDAKGEPFAEVFKPENRRVWVALGAIPEAVRNAFVAAEDKRFFQHAGLDERGLVRAFIGNMAQPGRPQGGSTITQQVAKNLIVGNDVTYERKLREIIVAARMERVLSKQDILEFYLNTIYLGRGAWGIEMAARSYFGKPAAQLTAVEGALLAGLAKGPNHFNPDRHPERARERLAYVLGRMQEDGFIAADAVKPALPQLAAVERLRRDSGFHFVDYVAREAKSIAGIDGLTASSYVVRSTINPALQRAVEATLQEGLARYELNSGRFAFEGAEANLAEAVQAAAAKHPSEPPWLLALKGARLPLYDVHWQPAIVVENARGRHGDVLKAGLGDGRILPLHAYNPAIRRQLKLHDVVYVQVREAKAKSKVAARADLRIRPTVQGAAVVLENATGRILAMTGGFSYPASQLNRATQSLRQPGSTLKPLTYLAALRNGLQPNTLIHDAPITLAPVGSSVSARERDYWTPKNFDGGAAGIITLRRALENSRNLATAQLMANGVADSPEQGLDRVCELAVEAQLYKECVRFYPFVLGAQPLRLIDLAAFYAAVANEGARPLPHAIAAIEQNGRKVFQRDANRASWIGAADRASFYQLKSILQGVIERGTARASRHLAPYVAGKTGTTDDEVDAWFVGFTNEVTVALWVGHDNGEGKRRTLGRGQTGGKVALPMLEPILEAAWQVHAPRTRLAAPSAEALRQLVRMAVDPYTGDPVAAAGTGRAVVEYFKRDAAGAADDTQFRIVSRGESNTTRIYGGDDTGSLYQRWSYDQRYYREPPLFQQQPWFSPPRQDYYRPWRGSPYEDDAYPRAPRRVDPDYLWRRPY